MRVFVTGATGFVGRHLAQELGSAGHDVVGLARTDAAATELHRAGATAHRGSLEDHDSLRRGAADADAVVHLGFDNDFSRFGEVCAVDQAAIEALGSALVGTRKRLIVPNGMAGLAPDGRAVTEADDIPENYPFPRTSEQTALRLSQQGVAALVMRLPQVHDTTKLGLASRLLSLASSKGASAYVGDGANGWAAAHVSDVVRLMRIALESSGSVTRLHAVAEEGVEFRTIAALIGRILGVPTRSLSHDDARAHFGPLGLFVGQSMAAAADKTKQLMSWEPTGPGLLADLQEAASREANRREREE